MGLIKIFLILFAVFFVAANAGLVRFENGEQVCVCTMIYNPVCASNGIRYSNKCTFECARDEAVAEGRAAITLTNETGACSD